MYHHFCRAGLKFLADSVREKSFTITITVDAFALEKARKVHFFQLPKITRYIIYIYVMCMYYVY